MMMMTMMMLLICLLCLSNYYHHQSESMEIESKFQKPFKRAIMSMHCLTMSIIIIIMSNATILAETSRSNHAREDMTRPVGREKAGREVFWRMVVARVRVRLREWHLTLMMIDEVNYLLLVISTVDGRLSTGPQ